MTTDGRYRFYLGAVKDPSALPARSAGPGQVFGVLLIAGGIAWLLAVTGVAAIPIQVMVSTLLVLLGLGMMLTRSSSGLVFLGALMVAFLALGTSDTNIRVRGFEGAGERIVSPDHFSALAPDYSMGAGQFTLDLSAIEIPEGVTNVEASLGLGEMVVIIPDGIGIEGDANIVGGEVIVFGRNLGSGLPVQVDLNQPGSSASILQLDLNLGFGTIEIRRDR
ncbi:MAG TPA: LiaF domain-containing protein [Actinomycetota bacterium]|nr:LiaF domain-containing protein [Actinomycetota bacterium]